MSLAQPHGAAGCLQADVQRWWAEVRLRQDLEAEQAEDAVQGGVSQCAALLFCQHDVNELPHAGPRARGGEDLRGGEPLLDNLEEAEQMARVVGRPIVLPRACWSVLFSLAVAVETLP